ncbi:histone-lysine N-methyltransferase SETMAR [Caerostris darwini]|uniref:Histone-lysine N-methyltransferase SETMAR n=1 Tax=Caerostris darwini TaxID=1538125 RepID=A0AAV4W9S4_9ARAC|nr:histone-lysine N-methyltransferase SETMAR [Caerostris darwini]
MNSFETERRVVKYAAGDTTGCSYGRRSKRGEVRDVGVSSRSRKFSFASKNGSFESLGLEEGWLEILTFRRYSHLRLSVSSKYRFGVEKIFGKSASQPHKNLGTVYGNEVLEEKYCQNWSAKFCSGDFSLRNAQRSGLPFEVDETHVKVIIDSDHHSTTREIADELNVSHTCIQQKNNKTAYLCQEMRFMDP